MLDDPIVLRLLDAAQVAALEADASRLDTPALRRLRAGIAVRSRYAEDCVADAVAQGVTQYVILGAGLDSFAYRSPFASAGLRVFEVDHPATQGWKRERLRAANVPAPASLTFVPIDFESETLDSALGRSGFDRTRPAILSWLGVTVYLTREAVLRTLAWVASLAAGSTIVFSYVAEPTDAEPVVRATHEAMAERAAALGEPWRTYFDPADLAGELARLGFVDVEDLGPDATCARYFADRSDGLRPGGAAHLVRASTPAR